MSATPTRPGLVFGMTSEARALQPGAATLTAFAGGRAEQARAVALEMVQAGADGLASVGIAGALSSGLHPGDIIIAASVIDLSEQRFACHPDWSDALRDQCRAAELTAQKDVLVGSDRPVLATAEKQRLHNMFGAIAVDMESHAVAAAARDAGVPFLALRVVADPADRAIPALAMAGLRPDGTTDALAVIRGLLRNPFALPALIRLGMDSRRALTSLGRVGALRFF